MQSSQRHRQEQGQTMTEYAVVLAVITPFIVAALAMLSDSFMAQLETVTGFLS